MIPMRINVKHGDSVYRRLNLHLLGIPRRDNRTNRNEAVFRKITEKNVFLMQTSSSTQNTRVHVVFIGKDNENKWEQKPTNPHGISEDW